MADNKLLEFRDQIDNIDKSILDLLEKRMKITDQVGEYKRQNNLPIFQKDREIALKEKLKSLAVHPILKESIDFIYQAIIETSKLSENIHTLKKSPYSRIGILGLGTIGGSIVKTLKAKNQTVTISSIKRDSQDLAKAHESGFIDTIYNSLEELILQNELIILASPIDTIESIGDIIAKIKPKQKVTIIDTASVKKSITKKFESISSEQIEFLPTHPMAGSEKSGFNGASQSLFIGRPWIICPHTRSNSQTIESIKDLIESLGSKPVVIDALNHDKYVAIVSHLIFLISTYLFDFAESHKDSLELAGTGFETTTRLASGNVLMHKEIVENNYENILDTLNQFIEYLKSHTVTKENAYEFFNKNKIRRDKFIESE